MPILPNTSQTFTYTSNGVQIVTLNPGRYSMICYGAKGGGDKGAKGDRTSGVLNLTQATTFYIQCGQMPTTITGGWPNGVSGDYTGKFGGGGSSKIYKSNGEVILEAKGGQGQGLVGGTTSATASRIRADGFTEFVDRSGVRCMEITPTVSGTLYFTSTSYSADPYGFIDTKNGNSFTQIAYNDDGGSAFNFAMSINVAKGTTYCLRIGAYSSAGNCYWYATYPDSNVKVYVAVATGGAGGGNNQIHASLKDTLTQEFQNASNGYVQISNIGYPVKCNNCTSSVSAVFGGESIVITSPSTAYKNGYYYYFSDLKWNLDNNAHNSFVSQNGSIVTIKIPSNIYNYGVSYVQIESLHELKMRTNSNFYKNVYDQTVFDYNKVF